jgi:hypothetical protein
MTQLCVLCGGECPPGWPVIRMQMGPAHAMKNWCDPLDDATEQAVVYLEKRGEILGRTFKLQNAIAKAGQIVINEGQTSEEAD